MKAEKQQEGDSGGEAGGPQQGLVIVVSASKRNGLLGVGVAILDRDIVPQGVPFIMSMTVAREEDQNLFTAELKAIATTLACIQK